MTYIASLAGVRYVVDHDAQTLSPVERADTRRPLGPQTAGDSRRLRAAELKRRRKGADRMARVEDEVWRHIRAVVRHSTMTVHTLKRRRVPKWTVEYES